MPKPRRDRCSGISNRESPGRGALAWAAMGRHAGASSSLLSLTVMARASDDMFNDEGANGFLFYPRKEKKSELSVLY